jgi:TonB family protein
MNKIIPFMLFVSLVAGLPAVLASDLQKAEQSKTENTKITSAERSSLNDYSRDMSERLKGGWNAWRPEITSLKGVLLDITVAKDGKVLKIKVVRSCGNSSWDREIVQFSKDAKLAPLPDWYKKETKTFTHGYSRRDYRNLKPGEKPEY